MSHAIITPLRRHTDRLTTPDSPLQAWLREQVDDHLTTARALEREAGFTVLEQLRHRNAASAYQVLLDELEHGALHAWHGAVRS